GVINMGTGSTAQGAFTLTAAAGIPVVSSAHVQSDTNKERGCAPGPRRSAFAPHAGGTVGPTQNGPWCAGQKKLTLTIASENVTANTAATGDAPSLAPPAGL